jgi:hypothetical protein
MLDVSTHNQEKIKEYLTEIIMKLGPYKRDNYEHAVSVMNNSTKKAKMVWGILFPDDDRWKTDEKQANGDNLES